MIYQTQIHCGITFQMATQNRFVLEKYHLIEYWLIEKMLRNGLISNSSIGGVEE